MTTVDPSWRFANSDSARQVREARAREQRRQGVGPLFERERRVKFWRASPWHSGSDTPPCWALYCNASFRSFLMPGLRATLDAHDRAWRDQHAAEMREHALQWEATKAARKAARAAEKRGQPGVFA